MPPPTYQIEPRSPESIHDELMRVWADNLPVEGTVAEKFKWLYRDPAEPPDTVFTLTADGAIVGSAGVLTRRFQVAHHSLSAALLADLAVDHDHRSLLPALRLVRAAQKHALHRYGFAYGFPNDSARGVFKRARYRELGAPARYARVLRHAPYVERGAGLDRVPRVVAAAMKNAIIARVVGAVADVGRLSLDATHSVRAVARFRLEWIDAPDERFDKLWHRARHDYTVIAERTASFLRWRYPATNPCRIAALIDRASGDLRAYAFLQQVDGVAHVRDLFGHLDDLGALLDLLVPRLYAQHATSVSIRYLGAPRVVSILAAHGFQARETERTVALRVSPTMADAAALIEDPEQWHLTDLDEDV